MFSTFRPKNFFREILEDCVHQSEEVVAMDKYEEYVRKYREWEDHVRSSYELFAVRAVMTFVSLRQNRAIGADDVITELPIQDFVRHPHYERWVFEANRGFQYLRKCIYYGDKIKACHTKLNR